MTLAGREPNATKGHAATSSAGASRSAATGWTRATAHQLRDAVSATAVHGTATRFQKGDSGASSGELGPGRGRSALKDGRVPGAAQARHEARPQAGPHTRLLVEEAGASG